jgi:branched-subunit amino acid ABC-type transport system permease component
MTTFLQISFSGLATGAIFAVAAVGFALLWQTAGAINFAHGEFIVLPAVVMLVLGERRPTLGLPDWVPWSAPRPSAGRSRRWASSSPSC